MLEALIALTPLLMWLSYHIGYKQGRKIFDTKERYITFFNGKLIEEYK